jgi:hypothetical protein
MNVLSVLVGLLLFQPVGRPIKVFCGSELSAHGFKDPESDQFCSQLAKAANKIKKGKPQELQIVELSEEAEVTVAYEKKPWDGKLACIEEKRNLGIDPLYIYCPSFEELAVIRVGNLEHVIKMDPRYSAGPSGAVIKWIRENAEAIRRKVATGL